MDEGDNQMVRKPKKPSVPPLVESDDTPEIFATDVVGAGVIGGCISINLAAHRWSVPAPGKDPETADPSLTFEQSDLVSSPHQVVGRNQAIDTGPDDSDVLWGLRHCPQCIIPLSIRSGNGVLVSPAIS